jgi:hypothetical protein
MFDRFLPSSSRLWTKNGEYVSSTPFFIDFPKIRMKMVHDNRHDRYETSQNTHNMNEQAALGTESTSQ